MSRSRPGLVAVEDEVLSEDLAMINVLTNQSIELLPKAVSTVTIRYIREAGHPEIPMKMNQN